MFQFRIIYNIIFHKFAFTADTVKKENVSINNGIEGKLIFYSNY